LRKDFEAQFGPEYAAWLQWLGAVRQSLMARGLSFQVRKRLLGYLARRESFQRWRAGNKRRLPLREAA
jgi:hypothetical protein